MFGGGGFFPPAFIKEIERRDVGVVAEYVSTGAIGMEETVPYGVVIDRISHEVPFYRTLLKHVVLRGVTVINNPFMWTADDKFFGATLASSLGLAHPKTVVLPNKEYIPGIVHTESLRNLVYPLDWEAIVDYIGLPCILKDAHGGGWKEVYVCKTKEELLHNYDHSGLLTMIVQEFIEWDEFVRCICLGQERDPADQVRSQGAEVSPRAGFSSAQADAARGRGLPDPGARAGLRHEFDRVGHQGRRALRHRLHESRAGHGHQLAHARPTSSGWSSKMADMAIRLAKEPPRQAKALVGKCFPRAAPGRPARARRASRPTSALPDAMNAAIATSTTA